MLVGLQDSIFKKISIQLSYEEIARRSIPAYILDTRTLTHIILLYIYIYIYIYCKKISPNPDVTLIYLYLKYNSSILNRVISQKKKKKQVTKLFFFFCWMWLLIAIPFFPFSSGSVNLSIFESTVCLCVLTNESMRAHLCSIVAKLFSLSASWFVLHCHNSVSHIFSRIFICVL